MGPKHPGNHSNDAEQLNEATKSGYQFKLKEESITKEGGIHQFYLQVSQITVFFTLRNKTTGDPCPSNSERK